MCRFVLWSRRVLFAGLFVMIAGSLQAQDNTSANGAADINFDQIKPVPILTGSTAYFTRVTGGTYQNTPSVSPLLLLPIGDKWLLEAKGSYSDSFAKNTAGDFAGTNTYGIGYAQIDYIANRFVTLTAGRFITPFNIYGERLAPNWIRDLQVTPLTSPITSGSALGGMMRGGFPAGTENLNIAYAFYFSANNTHHLLATDRSTGGRVSFFLPQQRLEIGASYQQVLQLDRSHATGVFMEWQPNRAPLTLRSEYARTSGLKGSAYWIESAYRLSQIPISTLRRLELVGRGQQFFTADDLSAATIKKLGALGKNTQEGDFGMNYYFRSDVRASASYGRQFVLGKDANIWSVGMTYRFVMPLGPSGRNM